MRYFYDPRCNLSGYLALIAMLLSACASTELNAVWKDPTYKARPAKIMVVGVARNPLNRRIFEDEFVAQLKARGTEAIASYTVLPDQQESNREAIAAKVKDLGADSILITRLVSKKIIQTYVPGTRYYPPPLYGSWPNYYGYGYRYMHTPDYIFEDEYAVMETNLYEAKSDKLVWAASYETGILGSDTSLIQGYVGIMVRNMIGQGLLGK